MTMSVDLEDLQRRSSAIRAELANMPQPAAQGQIAPPSAHQVSTESATRLSLISLVVWTYQAWGTKEGERLAESLDATYAAYQAVDTAAQQALNSDGNQPITVMTQPVSPEPVPTPPSQLPVPAALTPTGFATPPIVQQQLETGDQGASLRDSGQLWKGFAGQIRSAASVFEGRGGDWEGMAADAAHAKLDGYRAWLDKLANSWEELSTEATRLADVHQKISEVHLSIAELYQQAEQKLAATTEGAQVAALLSEMQQAQGASEELISQYARAMSPKVIQPEHPPNSGLEPTAATRNPNAKAAQNPAERMGSPGVPGGAVPGGPAGASQATQPNSAPQPTGAAQPAGGASAGGTPSGGGAPSGGAPSGQPGGGPSTGKPKPMKDPRITPAARGGGAGALGGGGGGGPTMPLSPAVSAETVAPRPPTHAASAGATTASTGAGGGAMGGGMAPMHGAGHGNQSKDKRRDPSLAPDEDLYVEDRPWTEAVIGNRRRRDVQDKDST